MSALVDWSQTVLMHVLIATFSMRPPSTRPWICRHLALGPIVHPMFEERAASKAGLPTVLLYIQGEMQ